MLRAKRSHDLHGKLMEVQNWRRRSMSNVRVPINNVLTEYKNKIAVQLVSVRFNVWFSESGGGRGYRRMGGRCSPVVNVPLQKPSQKKTHIFSRSHGHMAVTQAPPHELHAGVLP